MTLRSVYPVVLLSAVALLSLVRASGRPVAEDGASVPVVTDGAYRDGVFVAQLDAQQRRPAHIASGRWNSAEDRASYIAGYRQGFDLTVAGESHQPTIVDAAQLAGYSDGVVDGSHDRKGSQPFQPARGDHLRQANVKGVASDAYRLAYTNGYQQGYYSREGSAEMIGQASHHF